MFQNQDKSINHTTDHPILILRQIFIVAIFHLSVYLMGLNAKIWFDWFKCKINEKIFFYQTIFILSL